MRLLVELEGAGRDWPLFLRDDLRLEVLELKGFDGVSVESSGGEPWCLRLAEVRRFGSPSSCPLDIAGACADLLPLFDFVADAGSSGSATFAFFDLREVVSSAAGGSVCVAFLLRCEVDREDAGFGSGGDSEVGIGGVSERVLEVSAVSLAEERVTLRDMSIVCIAVKTYAGLSEQMGECWMIKLRG